MFYTLDGAVKVTGLSKSALLRALECGQINGTKDLFDEWRIERSELCQISRPLAEYADKNGTSTSTVCNAATLEAEIASLVKDAGDSLRGPLSGFHRDMDQAALQLPAVSRAKPMNVPLRGRMILISGLKKLAWVRPHGTHISRSVMSKGSPRPMPKAGAESLPLVRY